MRGEKGVSLVSVMVLSIVTLVLIGSVFYLLTRTIGVSASVPTYMTLRDAASSGVHYAVTQIKSGTLTIDHIGGCEAMELRFKLGSTGDTYTTNVQVCLVGYMPPPGYQISGVAYSREIPGGKGYIYSIVSEARGPAGTYSRIESLYTP